MRKLVAGLFAVATVATSCFGGGSTVHTVLVDYKHDQYASSFYQFFPKTIEAHPGDTVTFHQSWTGEPHSVTMGTEVDKLGVAMKPYLKIFDEKGYAGLPPDPPKKIMEFEKNLPPMVDDKGTVNQAGAEPCFLRNSLPSTKGKACTAAQRRQPEFTGTYKYYNSGFIPYQGENGDTYTVKIASNAKPGSHFFYCNYHYEFMSGFLDIKSKDEEIKSQEQTNKEAQALIDKSAVPLLRDFRSAKAGKLEPEKSDWPSLRRLGLLKTVGANHFFRGRLAGLGSTGVDDALINEFIPKNFTVRAGQKFGWTVIHTHTISFNVPKYFPIYTVGKSGKVTLNPKIIPPAGGAKDISDLGETPQHGPPVVDEPTWNGTKFWSTGLIESEDFAQVNMRISKPGTYKFACLIHPPMVGTIKVT